MCDVDTLEFEKGIREKAFKDIRLLPVHGRGLLCGALSAGLAVTGSEDHGIRIYDASSGIFVRELFSKKEGHHDWVTDVKILQDSRSLVSAGMDGIICLWNLVNKSSENLVGHQASISKILVDHNSIMLSASYDCTLRLWKLSQGSEKSKNVQILMGPHKNPIVEMCWSHSLVIAGDKKGMVSFWDINTAQAIIVKKLHDGPCNKISFMPMENTPIVATAGQRDGKLILYDLRTSVPIYNHKIHEGGINSMFGCQTNIFITSTNTKIAVINITNLNSIQHINVPSPVIIGKNVGRIGLLGIEDGSLLALNMDNRKSTFVCNKSLVQRWRFIETCVESKAILCGGEEPGGLLLKF